MDGCDCVVYVCGGSMLHHVGFVHRVIKGAVEKYMHRCIINFKQV